MASSDVGTLPQRDTNGSLSLDQESSTASLIWISNGAPRSSFLRSHAIRHSWRQRKKEAGQRSLESNDINVPLLLPIAPKSVISPTAILEAEEFPGSQICRLTVAEPGNLPTQPTRNIELQSSITSGKGGQAPTIFESEVNLVDICQNEQPDRSLAPFGVHDHIDACADIAGPTGLHYLPNMESENQPDIQGVEYQAGFPYHALGVVLVDPFRSCPFDLSHQDQLLLHWWLGPYATMMLGKKSGPRGTHPITEIWSEELHSPSAFHAVLSCAALHKAYHTGEENYTLSIYHQTEAIHLLNEQLSIPALAASDNAIATVIRLLAIEDWWGSPDAYQLHRRGLDQMVQIRGGPETLRSNWRIEVNYLSIKLVSRPRWSYIQSKSTIPAYGKAIASAAGSISSSTLHTLRSLCECAADFCLDLKTLAFDRASVTSPMDAEYPAIYQAAQLCCSPSQHKYTSYIHFQAYIEETIGFATLLYIAIVFRDAINKASVVQTSFNSPNPLHIMERVLKHTKYHWSTAVGRLHIILQHLEVQELGHTMRWHRVLKFMEVARLLPLRIWNTTKERIYKILCGDNKGSVTTWTADTLFRAITEVDF